MVDRRMEADAKAREAVDLVERKLVQALDGESLRGSPNLGDKVFGFRVGVEGSQFAKLPKAAKCLVLDQHGMLIFVTTHGGTAMVQRAPRGLVRASVLVPYVRAVKTAIDLHLRRVPQRSAEFERMTQLAAKIAAAMS